MSWRRGSATVAVMSPLPRLLGLVAPAAFAALAALVAAAPPTGAPAIRMLRTLPGDAARVDIAADMS